MPNTQARPHTHPILWTSVPSCVHDARACAHVRQLVRASMCARCVRARYARARVDVRACVRSVCARALCVRACALCVHACVQAGIAACARACVHCVRACCCYATHGRNHHHTTRLFTLHARCVAQWVWVFRGAFSIRFLKKGAQKTRLPGSPMAMPGGLSPLI